MGFLYILAIISREMVQNSHLVTLHTHVTEEVKIVIFSSSVKILFLFR